MAGRHAWDGKEIDDLSPEILNYSIKETPRSTLKEIANRLNADSISAGNWETLAEKLGFLQNSVLDNLMQQAKVLNTYPGLLMLQEWACRPGSTAFVLLHALREIQREDVVGLLVEKLFELHTMQLSVNVKNRTGVHQFLRVRTRKSAPLHASLENTLPRELYWYNITGPRHDINWNTLSGQLQGAQLTLQLRDEPSQEDRNLIYGTSMKACQPPNGSPPDFQSSGGGNLQLLAGQPPPRHVNQLELNIPPQAQPNISVTIPMDPFGQATQLDVRTEGGVRLVNYQPALPQNVLQLPSNLPPPAACGPGSGSPVGFSETTHNLGLPEAVQPVTDYTYHRQTLPLLSDFDDTLSTVPLPEPRNFSTSPKSSVSFGYDLSRTALKEVSPTSFTDFKRPVPDRHGARYPDEHEETSTKAEAKPVCGNVPMQHEEMGFSEKLQSSDRDKCSSADSFMHPDYVPHNSVIQFSNDPVSPQSCSGSDVSTASVTTASSSSRQPPSHFLHLPQAELGGLSTSFQFPATAGQSAARPAKCKQPQGTDYVPHSFIEQQSENFRRSGSALALNEEELMQTEETNTENSAVTGVDSIDDHSRLWTGNSSYSNLSSSSSLCAPEDSKPDKPVPCSYSAYRPDMIDAHHHYQNIQRREAFSDSGSLGSENGYMDMSGTHHHTGLSQQQQDPSSESGAILHSCMSIDSYLNDSSPDFDIMTSDSSHFLDNSSRNRSAPDLSHFSQPRDRRPITGNAVDVFQPRNRRPLTQGHDRLLLADTSSEYSYIDPASITEGTRNCDSHTTPSTPRSNERSGHRKTSRGNATEGENSSDHRTGRKNSTFLNDLEHVPGWHPKVNEKTVEREMMKYINDDGNFIVWRYSVGGKFVISVSHLRNIRHYAVYETEPRRDGQVYYFVFKGKRFTSVPELVQHCQQYGLSEPVKTFRTPDGREAHRGSGRFSHVQLKTPIPRRN